MRRTVVVIALCAVLGACSSSTDSKTSATPTPSAASTGSSATDTAGPNSSASVGATTPGTSTQVTPSRTVNPCAIVTTDDVGAAFGGTVAAGVVNPDNGGCDYELTGQTNTGPSGVLAQVSIKFEGEYQTFESTKVVFPDIEKVDGLGKEAWYYSVASQLHIDLGGQELVISGVLPGDRAAVKAEVIAFAHTVTGKL